MLALQDLSTAFYAHIFVSNTCLKKMTQHDTDVKLKVCQKWHTFGVYGKIIQAMSKMTHFCVKHLSPKMTQHDTDVKLKVCQKYWHTFGVYGKYKCVKNDTFFNQTLVPKKAQHDTDVKLKVCQKWHTFGVSLHMCWIHCVSKMAQ